MELLLVPSFFFFLVPGMYPCNAIIVSSHSFLSEEAWTNATALRYKEEKDRIDGTSTTDTAAAAAAAAASDPTVQKEEEKAQERASRVVRCLNLAHHL